MPPRRPDIRLEPESDGQFYLWVDEKIWAVFTNRRDAEDGLKTAIEILSTPLPTTLHPVLGNNGQCGDQEKTGADEDDKCGITSTDEDAINRLVCACKHLAILAGSPSKELFGN